MAYNIGYGTIFVFSYRNVSIWIFKVEEYENY